jgi:biopolymer transport protein ExbB
MKGITFKILVCAGLLGTGLMFAQDALTPETPVDETGTNAVLVADIGADTADKEKTAWDEWMGYLEMGGIILKVHVFMSIIALAAIIERFVNLRKKRIVPDNLSVKAAELWKNKKFAEINNLCAKDKSALARVIEALLEQRGNHDVAQVKMFAEDKASRELRLEARRASIISVIATLSPLVGLFGTVVGLMRAFMTVAQVGEMGDPAVLADDIGMALITTVSGLTLAMPAMFIYAHFRSRIGLFAVLLEEEVSALVNAWFVKKG